MLIVTIETLQTSEFAEFIYGSLIYLLAQGNRGLLPKAEENSTVEEGVYSTPSWAGSSNGTKSYFKREKSVKLQVVLL